MIVGSLSIGRFSNVPQSGQNNREPNPLKLHANCHFRGRSPILYAWDMTVEEGVDQSFSH